MRPVDENLVGRALREARSGCARAFVVHAVESDLGACAFRRSQVVAGESQRLAAESDRRGAVRFCACGVECTFSDFDFGTDNRDGISRSRVGGGVVAIVCCEGEAAREFQVGGRFRAVVVGDRLGVG